MTFGIHDKTILFIFFFATHSFGVFPTSKSFAQEKTASFPSPSIQLSTRSGNETRIHRKIVAKAICDFCDPFATDFYYRPKSKLLYGPYERIQKCQAKMEMRHGDEFWWVSTRHLPLDACEFDLCYYQYVDCGAQRKTLGDLQIAYQSNSDLINVVYVHENRADLEKSKMRFWQNYNVLINQAPNAPPIRYIFFTWPADQIKGQLRDVKTKAEVCDYHAYYLATFLSQLREFKLVSLCGYSYGARMALDALHILGGGCKKGRALPHEMLLLEPKFRAAFVATAMQNQCLPNGGLCNQAYQTLDHITLLNNSRDKVLRLFPRLPPKGSQAIGREGISVMQLADCGSRISQFDCTEIAGRSHRLEEYYKSERIRRVIRDTIFWHETGCKCR